MTDRLSELIELDARGFILPPGTDCALFCETARRTLEWSHALRTQLSESGRAQVMSSVFTADQLAPDELMEECLRPVAAAYRIEPTWVPAFFSNSYLPWYVGGATFYDDNEDGFRVCMVLRAPFRHRRRWFIYDRSEIVSHEACHVARGMFGAQQFEESHAYAISRSRLRRHVGGVFRARWEAPALLGSSAVLLAGTVLEMMGVSPWLKLVCALPLVSAIAALAARARHANALLKTARRFLEPVFAQDTGAVLFRCSDEEIISLARAGRRGGTARQWLDEKHQSPRWQVISARFLPEHSVFGHQPGGA